MKKSLPSGDRPHCPTRLKAQRTGPCPAVASSPNQSHSRCSDSRDLCEEDIPAKRSGLRGSVPRLRRLASWGVLRSREGQTCWPPDNKSFHKMSTCGKLLTKCFPPLYVVLLSHPMRYCSTITLTSWMRELRLKEGKRPDQEHSTLRWRGRLNRAP